MRVVPTHDGQFQVADGSGHFIAGPFETNAEAWRALDRLSGDPISPAEKRADWLSTKILSSGPQPIVPKKQSNKQTRKQMRTEKRMKRAAAKAPRWVRDIAAANFDPNGNRQHRDSKLGTFGAASAVRHIDPAEYSRQGAGEAA